MIRPLTYLQAGIAAVLLTPALLTAQDIPDQASDEAAVRKVGTEYVDAFNKRDAKKLASYWSPEAVYVNRISGEQVVGRAAIEAQFTVLFESASDVKIDVDVESIQFVSPNVAAERGTSKFMGPDSEPSETEYSAVYVRRDGTWMLDRVTDEQSLPTSSSFQQLEGLEWLIGSWVDQDESIRIVTNCSWTKNRNFLVRKFSVSAGDNVELTGMQIIGWDAATKKIRSWTFDSAGGIARGVWTKSKDHWYVHKTGTTAEGETTTAVNHVTPVDDTTFAFQSTQRTLAGELLPNIDEVLVVRQ